MTDDWRHGWSVDIDPRIAAELARLRSEGWSPDDPWPPLDDKDLVQWREAGFDDVSAQSWNSHNFDLGDAVEWMKAGFAPDESGRWAAEPLLCNVVDAAAWRAIGCDCAEAAAWASEPLRADADDAGDWKRHGFTVREAQEWADESLPIGSATEARAWERAAGTPEEARRWAEAPVLWLASFGAHGPTPDLIEELIDWGVTPDTLGVFLRGGLPRLTRSLEERANAFIRPPGDPVNLAKRIGGHPARQVAYRHARAKGDPEADAMVGRAADDLEHAVDMWTVGGNRARKVAEVISVLMHLEDLAALRESPLEDASRGNWGVAIATRMHDRRWP